MGSVLDQVCSTSCVADSVGGVDKLYFANETTNEIRIKKNGRELEVRNSCKNVDCIHCGGLCPPIVGRMDRSEAKRRVEEDSDPRSKYK